jgi:hypothetical protein
MGFILQGFGSLEQGNAEANAANYNAVVSRNNAYYVANAGQVQAQNQSLQQGARLGQMVASQAANSVDVNSGSALAEQRSQREVGEVDTETALNNALLQAYGYKAQSALDTEEAKADQKAGEIGAAGSFIQGAAQFGGSIAQQLASSSAQQSQGAGWSFDDDSGNVAGAGG